MYNDPIVYDGNETETDSNISWKIPKSLEEREIDNLWKLKLWLILTPFRKLNSY